MFTKEPPQRQLNIWELHLTWVGGSEYYSGSSSEMDWKSTKICSFFDIVSEILRFNVSENSFFNKLDSFHTLKH